MVKYGFYEDWRIDPHYDLTAGGITGSNVKRFVELLNNPEAKILICTYATLRFAYEEVADDAQFDDTMVAIDEFHHISADDNSVLGTALKNIMHNINSISFIFPQTGNNFEPAVNADNQE